MFIRGFLCFHFLEAPMRALAAAAAVLLAGPAAAADKPNFVFVLVDDLRYDGLGCTGHPFILDAGH